MESSQISWQNKLAKMAEGKSEEEILEMASKLDMMRILECPICNEIPFPPIYTCSTGHIVCSNCRPKLAKCALCNSSFTNARSFVTESIVLSSKFPCEYKEEGCEEILTGDKFRNHLEKCKFRPFKCQLGDLDNCNDSSCFITGYFNHLKNVHKVCKVEEIPSSVIDRNILKCNLYIPKSISEGLWGYEYAEINQKTFVSRIFIKNHILFATLSIIDFDNVANDYFFKFKILGDKSKSNVLEYILPVYSVSKSHSEFEKKLICASIPITKLQSLMKKQHESGLIFTVTFELFQKSLDEISLLNNPVKPVRRSLKYREPDKVKFVEEDKEKNEDERVSRCESFHSDHSDNREKILPEFYFSEDPDLKILELELEEEFKRKFEDLRVIWMNRKMNGLSGPFERSNSGGRGFNRSYSFDNLDDWNNTHQSAERIRKVHFKKLALELIGKLKIENMNNNSENYNYNRRSQLSPGYSSPNLFIPVNHLEPTEQISSKNKIKKSIKSKFPLKSKKNSGNKQ